ncbi:MAG: folate family ECF transporter S component [Lachnospiraceae bacterium]|nr:folate family ECF transporter S component [Lachnospiraceae bacterium]
MTGVKRSLNVRTLTVCAMLLAVAVILGFFKIPISNVAEIRLQFLPVACGGMLFGPVAGAILGGLTDILGFIVKPTGPYFPGFTVSGIVQGVIYGFILYKKSVSVKRIFAAQLIDTIIISLILNPIWLMVLYNQGFKAVFAARIIKVIIMLPINTVLLTVILKAADAAARRYILPDR